MSQEATKTLKEVHQAMTDAFFQMQKLVNKEVTEQENFIPLVNIFLMGVISTAADLAETVSPGVSAYIYADVEAGAKQGGLRAIQKATQEKNHYSVSNIDANDIETAMNYLGQQLTVALYKGLHELPKPLRTVELQLRCIEAFLANLLNQKINNPHDVLDSFCEHVHMAPNNLKPVHNGFVRQGLTIRII